VPEMTLVKRRSSIKFTTEGQLFHHLREEMVLVAVSVFGKGSRKGFCVVEDTAHPKRHDAGEKKIKHKVYHRRSDFSSFAERDGFGSSIRIWKRKSERLLHGRGCCTSKAA